MTHSFANDSARQVKADIGWRVDSRLSRHMWRVKKINISKATGPDGISGKMLLMLSVGLAPVLHTIFVQSFET